MQTPLDTVNQLVQATNAGDLATAVELYEPDAVLVVRPGHVAPSRTQLREALAGFVAPPPPRNADLGGSARTPSPGSGSIPSGRWSLRGTDSAGAPVTLGGESTDILRRQSDGRWLIAIDDPWGTQLLGSG